MRYIIFILFISFTFSCSFPDTEYFTFDKPQFTNLDEVCNWLWLNIDYVKDIESHGVVDYWQQPNETLNRGTGDCEDFSILLLNIINYQWKEKGNLLLVSTIHNGIVNHSCFEYKNKQYDIIPIKENNTIIAGKAKETDYQIIATIPFNYISNFTMK